MLSVASSCHYNGNSKNGKIGYWQMPAPRELSQQIPQKVECKSPRVGKIFLCKSPVGARGGGGGYGSNWYLHNCRKGAVLKNRTDAFVCRFELWWMDWGPHFWLLSNFNRLYLMLQQCRMSSKCFWKLSCESKVIPRNFTWGQTFCVSPYSFRLGSVSLARTENVIILFFSEFSLILHLLFHLAHHTAKF